MPGPGQEVNGSPVAMSAFGTQLTPPPMPPSMARLGTPPNLTGLFEGIAMSLLDKAATAELAAMITKISHDMVTYSTNAKAAAATYSAADVGAAADLATAAAKLAKQGIDLVKGLSAQGGGTKGGQQSNGQHSGQQPGQQGGQQSGLPIGGLIGSLIGGQQGGGNPAIGTSGTSTTGA